MILHLAFPLPPPEMGTPLFCDFSIRFFLGGESRQLCSIVPVKAPCRRPEPIASRAPLKKGLSKCNGDLCMSELGLQGPSSDPATSLASSSVTVLGIWLSFSPCQWFFPGCFIFSGSWFCFLLWCFQVLLQDCKKCRYFCFLVPEWTLLVPDKTRSNFCPSEMLDSWLLIQRLLS